MKKYNPKFVLFIQTQYKENYGAHAWDGKGECPQYWKFKGGEEIILSKTLSLEEALDADYIQEVVDQHKPYIEYKSECSEEYVISHDIEQYSDWVKRHKKAEKEWIFDNYNWPKTFDEVIECKAKAEEAHQKWLKQASQPFT